MIAILYPPLCVLFAWLNAKWISQGKKIKHGLNALVHLVAAFIVALLTEWYHFFTVLLIARVFFDWALSLFRKLPLGYVPSKPKSLADRIEKAIFKNDGITPKIIYIICIVCLLTL